MSIFKSAQILGINLFLMCSAMASEQISQEKYEEVARSKAWYRLMQYEPNMWGRLRSLVDGHDFFFAEKGKFDPYAELVASAQAMNQDLKIGIYKQHPQCALPVRYQFLKKHLGLNVSEVACPKLKEYLDIFHNPRAASLVFSSAYPNNPASMFGHTFIKIHSDRGSDLLDQGLNFAAYVGPDESSLAFIWRGLIGGYPGEWAHQPYYVKVDEYSNFESRDLWEYELDFTPEEVQNLVLYAWELATNADFEYYFFDENCSYQMLTLMTAIKPEWDILHYRIYVIPGETVKNIVFHPGVVRKTRFRPSFQKRVFQRYDALTSAEKKEFFQLINNEKAVTDSKSRFVLDAVAAYYDYNRRESTKKYQKLYEARREELLKHRSTLGVTSDEEIQRLVPLAAGTRPEIGHDAYVFALGAGARGREDEAGAVYSLRLKSAYHDLLNNDQGYTPFTHVDFPGFELRYDEVRRQVNLEHLNLLSVTSLYPWSLIDRRWSWRVNLGLLTARDYGCDSCLHPQLSGGFGGTLGLLGGRALAYFLATAHLELHHRLRRGYRYGPGFEVGALTNFHERYKLLVAAGADFNVEDKGHNYLRLDHSWSFSRNREVRHVNRAIFPESREDLNYWESRLEWLIFFN